MGEQPEWELWLSFGRGAERGGSTGDETQVAGLGASPGPATKRLARQRMQYSLPDQQELGREACLFRESFFEGYGKCMAV